MRAAFNTCRLMFLPLRCSVITYIYQKLPIAGKCNVFLWRNLPSASLIWRKHLCTRMTSKMDSLLNDPRRHFDHDTLMSKKKDGALLVVDVRQPKELATTGIIPDSINIPLNEIDEALAGMAPEAFRLKYGVEKPSKGSLIVFSCQSGRRSVIALEKALFHGYLNAGNYKGGWLDWESHTRQPQQ